MKKLSIASLIIAVMAAAASVVSIVGHQEPVTGEPVIEEPVATVDTTTFEDTLLMANAAFDSASKTEVKWLGLNAGVFVTNKKPGSRDVIHTVLLKHPNGLPKFTLVYYWRGKDDVKAEEIGYFNDEGVQIAITNWRARVYPGQHKWRCDDIYNSKEISFFVDDPRACSHLKGN